MKNSIYLIAISIILVSVLFTGCPPLDRFLTTSITPDGGGTISPNGGTYKNGNEVTLVATPANNYEFSGWAGDISSNTDRVTIKMNSDKNVVASFKKTIVNLQLNVSPSGSGSVIPGGGTYKNGTELTLVATPANNYEFSSWAGDISGNTDRVTIKMNSDKNVVASFKKKMVSLQLNMSPSAGGTLTPNSGSYEAGSQVKVTATPATGYRFLNWGVNATGTTNQINVLMDTDKIITANFIKQYTLKVSANPIEGGNITPASGVYDLGNPVNLTATQIFPYGFTNWTGTDNDNVYKTTVTMNSDKTITCNFTKLPPGLWIKVEGPVYSGNMASIPLQLNQFEYAEVEIIGGIFAANVKDPNGTLLKDFGVIQQGNYVITALITGNYSIVLQNSNTLSNTAYKINYRIYKRS